MSAAWIAPPDARPLLRDMRRLDRAPQRGRRRRRVCAAPAAILPADRSLTALGCAAWTPNERDPFAIARRRAAAAPPA